MYKSASNVGYKWRLTGMFRKTMTVLGGILMFVCASMFAMNMLDGNHKMAIINLISAFPFAWAFGTGIAGWMYD